jgi:hypothetical protein
MAVAVGNRNTPPHRLLFSGAFDENGDSFLRFLMGWGCGYVTVRQAFELFSPSENPPPGARK